MHVRASDARVTTAPIDLPDRTGPRYPAVPQPTKIDQLVVAKLAKLGVVPSDLCTDAEFLRRLSLDLTGTLPAPLTTLNNWPGLSLRPPD